MKKFHRNSLAVLAAVSVLLLSAGTYNADKDFKEGIEYTNKGMHEKAIKKFTEIISKDKNYGNAYFALGIVYINMKKEKEAEELLEKAVELEPENDKAYFVLARLYEKLDETDKAVAAWKKFLELKPDKKFVKIARRHLGRLNKETKDNEK